MAYAVCDRIYHRPAEANTDNCERSLKAAARGIAQMWDDVQRIKADRKRAIARSAELIG